MQRNFSTLTCVLFATALLQTSCSTEVSDLSPIEVWSNEIADAHQRLKQVPSAQLARAILEDDHISDAEMTDLAQQVERCMHDRGYDTFSFRPIDNNFGELEYPERWNEADYDQDENQCQNQTGSDLVTLLWLSMKQNPHNIDEDGLLISCLKKLQVVDPAYNAQELQQAFETYLAENRQPGGSLDKDPLMAVIPFTTSSGDAEEALRTCTLQPQSVLYPDK